MKIKGFTPKGEIEIELTSEKVMQLATEGNIEAINSLIDSKGGWNKLTTTQKEKITQLMLGRKVDINA